MASRNSPSFGSALAEPTRRAYFELQRQLVDLKERLAEKLGLSGGTMTGQLILENDSDVTTSDDSGVLIIRSPADGTNIGIDANEIQARINNAVAPLYLNLEGAEVIFGPGGARLPYINITTGEVVMLGISGVGNFNGAESKIQADMLLARSGAHLVLAAGESAPIVEAALDGSNGEFVYLVGEYGVKFVRSPDNWTSGWAGRVEWNAMPSDWTDVTFANNWTHWAAGYQRVQYRTIGDVVYLRGLARKEAAISTSTQAVFNVPTNLSPSVDEIMLARAKLNGSETAVRVQIKSTGAFEIHGTSATTSGNWLSVSGLSYSIA